ncbi:MAG: hypothetical protein ACLFWM_07155 [Actinomycetota bacterium]
MLDFMWGYVMGQRSASQAASFARSAGTADAMTSRMRMLDVDERIDRLVLLVEAMWSLLREQGFSDEELAERLMELDQADGSLDGRRVAPPSTCASCGSKVAAGLAACQFCGAAVPTDATPFESL